MNSACRAPLPSSMPIEEKAENRARLIFLNGVFQPELSHFGSVPSCILMGDLKSGYKLTLGEQTCLVAQPIELLFRTDNQAPKKIALKFSYQIGHNARLSLLENFEDSSSETTVETDIHLHERAKFVHGRILSGHKHKVSHQVRLSSGGYYSNFSLLCGGTQARNDIAVSMDGEQAQVALNGIMLLDDKDQAQTTTRVEHKAPHCASKQVYKTVLNGKAQGSFQGKVVVAPDAQKSDGYQLSRALLLSDQAQMHARPELEIYADDVTCSHGSTIGDLDEEALFYLRSRGLGEQQARSLLVEAFIGELIDGIQVEEWRDIFRQKAKGWAS